ncbi:hypothetical protein D3C85_1335660 [compost metagenome]
MLGLDTQTRTKTLLVLAESVGDENAFELSLEAFYVVVALREELQLGQLQRSVDHKVALAHLPRTVRRSPNPVDMGNSHRLPCGIAIAL